MDNSNKALWFVAGASIGATLAILFAPASGEETRRYIGSQARRGRERLSEAGRDAYDKGRDLFERGRDMADEAADMMEEGIDRARRTFQS
ncbi:MAG: YtxH domain-containing protein [Bryobacteraceae bacterium]